MDANNLRHQYHRQGTSYVEGNTVRKLNTVPDIRREKEQYEIPSPKRHVQKQPKALNGMSMASLFILSLAMAATLFVCVEYLKLQTEVGRMEKELVTLEGTLSTMTKNNDAAYEQINLEYDLGYVYQVAVEELGMVYPDKNMVITYENKEENYMRQYKDIPE